MATLILDNSLCEQLSECIENLTTSGSIELEANLLKKIKSTCKKSDDYVNHAYHLLTHQLEKDHSQIRLSTVLICDELFRRSHRFRELLVEDFQTFMELTVGCDLENELPPPHHIAVKLKSKALECIGNWYDKFGEGYKKLSLGYHFLKECKNTNFENIGARSLTERAREEEANRRQEIVNNEKLKILQIEMNESLPEIKSCIEQMQTCYKLLRPDSVFNEADFDDPQPCCSKSLAEDENKNKEMEELVKEHGLGNSKYTLTINVSTVPVEKKALKVTTDNKDIVRTLQELLQLSTSHFLPSINKWIQIAIKCSTSSDELKKAIDLKNRFNENINKCKQLGVGTQRISEELICSSSDDDDDFEEVATKDGYEPIIPVHQRNLYGLPTTSENKNEVNKFKETAKDWKVFNEEESEALDPTSFKHNAKKLETLARSKGLVQNQSENQASSTTTLDPIKKELLARAPRIRVVELAEVKIDAAAVTLKQDIGHRFWTSGQDRKEKKSESLKLGRIVEVDSDLNGVKWSCRVLLPSGKLCPRRDRYKCPLHGVIIARNNMGQPSKEEDKKALEKLEEKKNQENPEWQDPQLLKDLQAVTGIDLTVKKRGKKDKNSKKNKKAKKFPNLIDLKSSTSTSRSRIQKKVFNAASVKRVASVLDQQDNKKFNDKFGNQFNYSWEG